MRTEQLSYLIEISKHKSMNIASQKLHISPQALSTAMKGLEKELNLHLLERTTTGVSLTKDGERLKDIALQFFYDLSELQAPKQKTQQHNINHLSLHVPYGFCESYLPRLLEQIYADTSDIEISAIPHDYAEIIQLIDEDVIPFGLSYKMYINGEEMLEYIPKHMSFTPLYEAKFFAAIPGNLPIANYKTISLKTLLEHPLISHSPSYPLMAPVYHYSKISPRLIESPTTNMTASLLANGKGVSIGMYNMDTEDSILQYPPNVRMIKLREKIQAVFGYIVKKNTVLSPDTIAQLQYLDRIYHAEQ